MNNVQPYANPVSEGRTEAVVESVKEEEKDRERFENLLDRGTRVLYKLKSVFPFAFFPDTISIDREKVTLKLTEFFFASEIRSLHIRNISHVIVDTGPFFATVTIMDRSLVSELTTVVIPFLWKGQALRARRIIQGLMIAHKERIDMEKIPERNLKKRLEDLGRMH